MISTSFQLEALEDWERALERPDGRPLVASIAGSIVVAVLLSTLFELLPIDLLRNRWLGLALATGIALTTWAIGWMVTLRQTTPAWKVGSALAYGATALMVLAWSIGNAQFAVRRDAAMLQTIRIDAMGHPQLPFGVRPGPIARRGLIFFGEVMGERHYRDDLFVKLGMDRIVSAPALDARPGLLRDCGRFARGKSALDASGIRVKHISTRFRAALVDLIPDQALRGQMLASFDKGDLTQAADTLRSDQLQRAQLDLAGDLCRLLGAHRWHERNSAFEFTGAADLQRYDTLIQHWNDGVRGQQELAARFRSRLTASGFDASGF